ncbi:MAG: RagB/SusD family nutrient uptake outer membrane protein, partial [Gemmatimonadetes bacterium]|nr:RagB/SusD family nutrient uptake outer membrane protein [Gemmatimonadota bacterium]
MAARSFLTLALLLLLTGCSEDALFVPDFNNPSLEDLQGDPSPSTIASAAIGVLFTTRIDFGDYVRDVGIIGRENYDLDGSDPRFVTELIVGPLDAGSRAFGGDHFYEPYAAIRNANVLLDAMDRATQITDAQKEAVRGYAKTLAALNLLLVINTHDVNGAPIDVNLPIGELAPIVGKDAVFDRIATLLEEARGHLQAGGDAFPFTLPSGFDGFDTPGTFLSFNRALAARVAVYRGNFAEALTALNESFLVACADFDRGVYMNYGTASGDLPNPIFEDPATSDIRAHPSLEALAQTQPGGELDRRFLEKTFETAPKTQQDHTSDLTFTIYETAESPIPIIRNEELLLLRAEANIGLGNIPAAQEDLNCIRTQVGGLATRTDLTSSNAVDELLYNRTFSLLFEGGHRWVDYRRQGRLEDLPIDVPGDVVHDRYPIPRD